MMQRTIGTLAVLVFSLHACKKQPSVDTSATVPAAATDTSPSALLDTSLVASLERGPCRGTCPAYHVEIFADGRVHFNGTRHVGAIGMRSGSTTTDAIRQLRQLVAASDFANADTAYVMGSRGCGGYATDLPVSTLTLRVGNTLKTIEHDPGCRGAPAFLKTLEAQVDTAAGSAVWIMGEGEETK